MRLNRQQPKTIALTDDRTTAGFGGCRASCGSRRCGVGLGNQSKGGLVVVVVHNAQVHGKDCCGCGWHLHGQRCRAHVNWKKTADESRKSVWHNYNARTRDIINAHIHTHKHKQSPMFQQTIKKYFKKIQRTTAGMQCDFIAAFYILHLICIIIPALKKELLTTYVSVP